MSVLRSLSALQMFHRATLRAGVRPGAAALPAVRRPLPPLAGHLPRPRWRPGVAPAAPAPTRCCRPAPRRGRTLAAVDVDTPRRRPPPRGWSTTCRWRSPPCTTHIADGLLPAPRRRPRAADRRMADRARRCPPTGPTPGRYDELADERGRPASTGSGSCGSSAGWAPAEIDERRRLADRLLVGRGRQLRRARRRPGREPAVADRPGAPAVARARLGRPRGRPGPAGPTPRGRSLADLYGPQRLLRDGVVPAELVFASAGFRWPCRRRGRRQPGPGSPCTRPTSSARPRPPRRAARPHRRARRAPATRWSTAGCSAGCSPTSTATLRVERLSRLLHAAAHDAGRAWPRPTAAARAPWSSRPASATRATSSTPTSPATSATTSSKGADLAVRGGRVWLRALAGLEPVDVVLRRVEDGRRRPPRAGRRPGPAGVPACSRRPARAASGWPTPSAAALAGDVALQAYLPAACELLLGERLLLASLPHAVAGRRRRSGPRRCRPPRRLVLHDTGPDGVTLGVRRTASTSASRPGMLAAIERQPGPLRGPGQGGARPPRRCCATSAVVPRHRGRARPGRRRRRLERLDRAAGRPRAGSSTTTSPC